MKTILITGSQGFIGSSFAQYLKTDYTTIGVDIIEDSQGICDYNYQCDICDYDALKVIFSTHSIDCVVHTAAEKSLIICEQKQDVSYKTNYDATIKLYDLARAHKSNFIFISSDQVFDGLHGYYKEEDKTHAINNYGRFKIMVEKQLKHDKMVSICRTALVFGEIPLNQLSYFEKMKHKDRLAVQGYIVQHVRHKLEQGGKIYLPRNEFVSPTHVNLLCRQLKAVLENSVYGILHCCGNSRISRYEIGIAIAKRYHLSGLSIDGTESEDILRPKDVSLDCKETQRKLGFEFSDFSSTLDHMD